MPEKLVTIRIALSFLVLSLVLPELILWSIGYSYPSFFVPDEHLGLAHRPLAQGLWTREGHSFVQINAHGWNDEPRTRHKTASTTRIAVLGDSYTQTFQVERESNYCSLLEVNLASCATTSGRSVEVLNFGRSGMGTAEELTTYRDHSRHFSPDIVILAFFAGNDIRNNSMELEPYKLRPFFSTGPTSLVLDNSFREIRPYRFRTSLVGRIIYSIAEHSRAVQLLGEVKNALLQPAADSPLAGDSRNDSLPLFPGIDLEVY